MFPYDKMLYAIDELFEGRTEITGITFNDVAKVTLLAISFFELFSEKLTVFRELITQKLIE
jgi:hypothetical protein